MGWFRKKEEVPEVPASPLLPDLPEQIPVEQRNLPELPSFPNSNQSESFNQEMVKSAVSDDFSAPVEEMESPIPSLPPEGMPLSQEIGGEPVTEEVNPDLQIRETLLPPPEQIPPEQRMAVEADTMPLQETQNTPLLPALPPKPPRPLPRPRQISPTEPPQEKPLFVRLDKFKEAQEKFETIRNKMKEIEGTLHQIKEVKSNEEEEIAGWAREIENLKTNLSEIDSNLFSQI